MKLSYLMNIYKDNKGQIKMSLYDDRIFKRSELNPSIKRYIKTKEKYLNRVCRKIWTHRNPKGELYLYGSFCKNYDRLIVTIGSHNPYINGGFLPQR